MKALLALRSVGICVGQRQMCLNVQWLSFSLSLCSKNSFVILSSVLSFTMNANGQRYVFVADFGARHCQSTIRFEASHSR